eukprot:scaffold71933_cov23-Tisochrysis_lutea.AAC.1
MCSSEDALGVAYEHTTVPGQEEVAVWRAPAASLASEEASFPTAAVIVASIMWPTQAPTHGSNNTEDAMRSCTE